jgi:hypothetical protein
MENRIALEFSEEQNCFHFNYLLTKRIPENTNGYRTISTGRSRDYYTDFIHQCRDYETAIGKQLTFSMVLNQWLDYINEKSTA